MFEKPSEIDDVTMAFPCSIKYLMPEYEEIPKEFRNRNSQSPYAKWVAKWFFKGLSEEEIPSAKEGIDCLMALRHLGAILRSFEPKHEHKEVAIAYLASLWLEEPKI